MTATAPTTTEPQRSRRPLYAIGAAVVLGFLAWLAFGFFGIQAAFIDNEVSEAGPVFASGAVATDGAEGTDEAATATTAMPSDAAQDEIAATDEFQEAMAEAEANPTEVTEDPMPGEITTPYAGTFSGNSRYDITGDALVLSDGTDQRFLRFENFDSSNGPDLNVYLRADDGSFVDLGDLKGNIGDQNYEIPADVDLSVFDSVEIWCVRFGVGFGQAELMATA